MGRIALIGLLALDVASHVGGVTLVAKNTLRRLVPPRLDGREYLRAMVEFGEASLPVVLATAGFTGAIMVLQGAIFVEQFGVYDLVGWYTGFATFREVGPILIGLMFSGRVGANNTSELATMRVTDQLDALRIMAIDPYEMIIVPRFVAMVLCMGVLTVLGNVFAVVAGAGVARMLLGIEFSIFARSLIDGLGALDFLVGVQKGVAFGAMVAFVSTHFGLSAKRRASGVGKAVNAQVVGCAVAMFATDYLLTALDGTGGAP